MDEKTAALLTEQLRHANHLLASQVKTLEARLVHTQALNDQRLAMLESQIRDHETRLRAATEGVTQFKLFAGLASGSSSLMSLAAILKAFLGG